MKNIVKSIILATTILLAGCSKNSELIPESAFNKIIKGKEVKLFTLKNKNGLITQITNYGGRVVNLFTPDKEGNMKDIVLGYSSIDGYLNSNEIYFGALIGRYGNRIARGQFSINEKTYTMVTNNGANHLHGGKDGFNNVVWDAEKKGENTLILTYISKDGEEGYPGNLKTKVEYTLTEKNELKVEYWAETDKPTHINLTHHSFFNLHGAGNGTINDHILQIDADRYTPVDEGLIPTGEIAEVENTPFDFRKPTAIGKRVNHRFDQLNYGKGYDHNFVLNNSSKKIHFAAKIYEPKSGRSIEVFTNEPGLQFYGGNFLNGSDKGKEGKPYKFRTAFCLETQHFPDTPNQPHFPSTLLNPGEKYHSVCIYKFGII